MEFEVYRCRREGKLLPRHVMWSTKVRGDLYIRDQPDDELKRTVRVASVRDHTNKELVAPLHDVMVISAKPDWWTMTGWERVATSVHVDELAYQQSWILIPADRA